MVLAVVYIICFAVGVPGNVIALEYFLSTRKDVPTCIYIFVTITDMLICLTVIPVASSFVNQRKAMMFGEEIVCTVWGVVWKILPYFSVFLVCVLSITRSIILLRPLTKINKKLIVTIITLYVIYLITRTTLPLATHYSYFEYDEHDVYCSDVETVDRWDNAQALFQLIELAFPVIPVLISCVTSTVVVLYSMRISKQNNSVNSTKRKATVTILIVTIVYIIFNIPVFVQYVIKSIIKFHDYSYKSTYYSSTTMKYYSWNVTLVLCVVLNSTLNPFIYFFRMEQFKLAVIKLFKRLIRPCRRCIHHNTTGAVDAVLTNPQAGSDRK